MIKQLMDAVLEPAPSFLTHPSFSPWGTASVVSLNRLMSAAMLVRLCVSPPLPLKGFPSSVRHIAFFLPDPAEPQEPLTLSEEGMSEKLASLSIRFICSAALIWTRPILSGTGGGWDRQWRRDKPRSEEMTSQMEEWQFLRFQMIIQMHYSELWRIMDLQEERLTEAAVSHRWGS